MLGHGDEMYLRKPEPGTPAAKPTPGDRPENHPGLPVSGTTHDAYASGAQRPRAPAAIPGGALPHACPPSRLSLTAATPPTDTKPWHTFLGDEFTRSFASICHPARKLRWSAVFSEQKYVPKENT